MKDDMEAGTILRNNHSGKTWLLIQKGENLFIWMCSTGKIVFNDPVTLTELNQQYKSL